LDISFEPDRSSDAFHVAGEIFAAAATASPAQARPARPRVAPRNPIDLEAGARKAGGSGTGVRVTDLSTHGFCMETHLLLAPGTLIWLRLPSLEMRGASVAWVRGALVGCAFEAPLSPFVVDLIVARARRG